MFKFLYRKNKRSVDEWERFNTSYVIIEKTGEYRDMLFDNYHEDYSTQEEAERTAALKNKNEKTNKYYVGMQRVQKR